MTTRGSRIPLLPWATPFSHSQCFLGCSLYGRYPPPFSLLYFLLCALLLSRTTGSLPGIEFNYGANPKFVCTPIPADADPSCFTPGDGHAPSPANGHSGNGHSSDHSSGGHHISDDAKATILHLRESLVRQKETILDQRETIRELTAKLALCDGHHGPGHHGPRHHGDDHHGLGHHGSYHGPSHHGHHTDHHSNGHHTNGHHTNGHHTDHHTDHHHTDHHHTDHHHTDHHPTDGHGAHHGDHHGEHHGDHHGEHHGDHHGDPHYPLNSHGHREKGPYMGHHSFSPEQTGKTLTALKEKLEALQTRNSTSTYSSSLKDLLQRRISLLEEQLSHYHSSHHGEAGGHHDDHHGHGSHGDHHGDHHDDHHGGHHDDHHPDGHHDDHHHDPHHDTHHDSHHHGRHGHGHGHGSHHGTHHGSHHGNHHGAHHGGHHDTHHDTHHDPHHDAHHDDHHGGHHNTHHDPHHDVHHDDHHHGSHHDDHHPHSSHHDDHHPHSSHHDNHHDDHHHDDHHGTAHHDDHGHAPLATHGKQVPRPPAAQSGTHAKLDSVLNQLHRNTEPAAGHPNLKSPDAFQIGFPMRTNYMYGRIKRTLLNEIFALTVCLWVKGGNGPGIGTPFSYSVPGQANELVLIEWGNNPMELLVNDKAVTLPLSITDSKWHHLCITWSTRDGVWEAYQDGVKRGAGESLSAWHPIKPGGVFILGQEQDTLGGRFDATQSFVGEMSDLQLWSRVLTPQEINNQASCRSHLTGDIITWMESVVELHGGVTKYPFDPCH